MTYLKVILYFYPRLSGIIADYITVIQNKAICSGSDSRSCQIIAEEIIELIEQKDSFYTLLEVIKKILTRLDCEQRYLLEYRYFRRESKLDEYRDLKLNYDKRTYYRRQNKLLAKLKRVFENEGIDEEWFLSSFKRVGFIMSAYNKLSSGEGLITDKRLSSALKVRPKIQ